MMASPTHSPTLYDLTGLPYTTSHDPPQQGLSQQQLHHKVGWSGLDQGAKASPDLLVAAGLAIPEHLMAA
jgi:hypothetical protein